MANVTLFGDFVKINEDFALECVHHLFSPIIYIFIINLYFYEPLILNCPCHLYGSIYHRMHNWAPHRLVNSKVYVNMEHLFLFWFCRLRCSYKKKRRAMLSALHSLKRGSCAGQFSTRALLSHTMTGKNRHTSFVNRLNFKSCVSHSVGFQ